MFWDGLSKPGARQRHFGPLEAMHQPAAGAPAKEENKPLLVLSLPSVDALLKDIAYLGTVSGKEGLEKLVEDQIKGKAGGLKGLDRAKPIGLAATTDGASFQFLAFVPA